MTIECTRCGEKGEHEGGGDVVRKISHCIKCQSKPDHELKPRPGKKTNQRTIQTVMNPSWIKRHARH